MGNLHNITPKYIKFILNFTISLLILEKNKTVTNVINKVSSQSLENDKEKLEKVLKDVKKVDETCDYKSCKQKTSLMGQTCSMCNKRFCYKHSLPEIHAEALGTKCDEIVKKKERDEFLHPKVNLQSNILIYSSFNSGEIFRSTPAAPRRKKNTTKLRKLSSLN